MDAKVNTDEPMNKPPESLAGTNNETNRSATDQELPQPLDGFEADTPIINEQSSPAELVDWGLPKFVDVSLVLTTSFGMEGCALMDLCSKTIAKHKLPNLTVACIFTDAVYGL